MKRWMKRGTALTLCLLLLAALLPGGTARAAGDLTLEEITDEELIRVLDETADEEIVLVGGEEDPAAAEPVGEEPSYGFAAVHIEPLYRSVLTEEQLAERLRAADAASGSQTARPNSEKYCQTVSAAGIYLREQMVKRSGTVSFLIPEELYRQDDDLLETIYERAVIHSDSRSGQEGDALRWGNLGWGAEMDEQYDDEHGECRRVTYSFVWTTTASQESRLTGKVNSTMSALNLDGKTEKQKIRAIHDCICDNVDYDYDHLSEGADYPLQFSAYAALCQGKAVCEGYAILFYRMAKEAGLGVRVIAGEKHAWNIVRVGSVYYNVDVTWDGQDAETVTTWYLKSMRDFAYDDHIREYPYYTDAFEADYPMVRDSKLNRDNLYRSFTTIDGGTVTTKALTKPKLLIFGSCYSGSTLDEFLRPFLDYDLSAVNVVVVDVCRGIPMTVGFFRDDVGGSGIRFCSDLTSEASVAMNDYLHWMGYYCSFVQTPAIFFIDTDNKVQTYRVGRQGPETMAAIVEDLLGVTLSYAPPRFTLQPESMTCSDGWAYFSVETMGKGETSYQWYYRKNASDTWKKCSGDSCCTPELYVEALAYRNGYQYRCKAMNDYGYRYSGTVTLTVTAAAKPKITTQPANKTAAAGTTAKLTVEASGAESYQWYYRTGSSGSWAKSTLTGNKTATLSVKATPARSGYQYRCRVTNEAGYVYSTAATLSVKPGITTQPKDQTASVGGTVSFTVTASGAASYQWYYRKSASGTWNKCTDGASATLTVEAKSYRSGYQYRCKVSNDAGYVYTNAVTLTVK